MPVSKPKKTPAELCPCRGVTLERLVRPAVMMILAQGDQYGYRLVQQLATMPIFGGQKPNTAGVYRCLKLLEQEGRVSSAWELSESGPSKRRYTLTPAGLECLGLWMKTLGEYRQAVDDLLALGRRILADKAAPDVPAAVATASEGKSFGCDCDCIGERKN